MKFKTTLPPIQSNIKLDHSSKTFLIGSCFSNEVGSILNKAGFNVHINPFGTLFSPVAIMKCLSHVVRKDYFTEKDFFQRDGIWYSYQLHSSLSSSRLEDAIQLVNERVTLAHEYFFTCDTLIITLGSAWIYELKENQTAVANCHKMPQEMFEKRKLGINEIVADYSQLIEHLKSANPKLKIIFTISPVKHLKDGIIENNWSKSTLNIAVHELVRRYDFTEYFPAFELINDDLRDYRFYKQDMAHPNEQAVAYVYEYYLNTYCSETTRTIAEQFKQLSNALNHHVFNRDSDEFKKYKTSVIEKAESVKQYNPDKAQEILNHFK